MKKKKLFAAFLSLVIVFGTYPVSFAEEVVFTDITNHWGKAAIDKWSGYGVINGYERLFRPDDTITRGELAVILDNMMDYQVAAANSFGDLPIGQFYTDAILKANKAGILLGDGQTVRPLDPITREETALMMSRAFKVIGVSTTKGFSDGEDVSDWAKAGVFGLESKGYISGSNGYFLPKSNITRAEVVTMIDNLVKAYYTEAGTYTENVPGNAVIKVPGVILKNMTISENLIVAEGVGSGNATLNNVDISGEMVVRGGGENSIIIIDASLAKVTVSKTDGKLRIVISGSTTVGEVSILSGAKLEESNLTAGSAGFQEIVLDAEEGDTIVLVGSFSDVEINTPGLIIDMPAGTTVENMMVNEQVAITGEGVVENAEVNVSGVTFETPPIVQDVAPGVTPPIIETPAVTPPPSSGGSHRTAVTGISITGEIGVVSGTALQLRADIAPTNATNTNLTWSLINGTGGATIDATGLLTVTTEGTITVTAISQSDPSVVTAKQMKVYKTIQAGIDGAVSGDAIFVAPGTYQEFVTINSKSNISLESSEGAENTIIKSRQTTGASPAVNITNSTGVAIDGFTITDVIRNTSGGIYAGAGATSYLLSSVLVTDSSDCTIQNNTLFDFVFGVFIDGESKENTGNLVSNNIINGNNVANKGVYIYSAMSPEVVNETTVTVSGNVISNTAYGVDIGSEADNIRIINNTLLGSNDVELPYAMTYTSPSSIWDNGRGISVRWQKHDLLIQGNTISNFQQGIKVAADGVNDAGDYTVLENEISDNLDFGIQNLNSTGVIDASLNYWGAASGPYNLTTNAIGTGDPVSDKVKYDPWYTTEAMTTTATAVITEADVSITSGSIVFQYSFDAGSNTLTYSNALGAPYYLNTTGSTVTLTNGTSSSAIVSLSALGISSEGSVSYADLAAVQSQFAGLNFVPTQVVLNLAGGMGVNAWIEEITVNLDLAEISLLAVF